jgi:hypothetical protein
VVGGDADATEIARQLRRRVNLGAFIYDALMAPFWCGWGIF